MKIERERDTLPRVEAGTRLSPGPLACRFVGVEVKDNVGGDVASMLLSTLPPARPHTRCPPGTP
jgi:hypothetical protein